MDKNRSGILLSGGMDSIALAYWLKPSFSITIDYGQKPAESEIQAAAQVSKYLGMEHHIIRVDCSQLGSGDMNGSKPLSVSPVSEWWPYRNQLLITLASMKAIMLDIKTLIIGSVATDKTHLDGTEKFYSKIAELVKLQEGNIEIVYPAINLSTVELVKKSEVPMSLLMWAHSCHTSNQPCMICNGCKKYLYVLQQLGFD